MFVQQSEYKQSIRETKMLQMLDNDVNILADCEDTAMAVIRDALYSRYDIEAVFAATGTARHKHVMRWIIVIVRYYIYQRLADRLMPDHVKEDYEEVLKTLENIADGKRSTNLALLPPPTSEDGTHTVISKFRWVSNPPRSH